MDLDDMLDSLLQGSGSRAGSSGTTGSSGTAGSRSALGSALGSKKRGSRVVESHAKQHDVVTVVVDDAYSLDDLLGELEGVPDMTPDAIEHRRWSGARPEKVVGRNTSKARGKSVRRGIGAGRGAGTGQRGGRGRGRAAALGRSEKRATVHLGREGVPSTATMCADCNKPVEDMKFVEALGCYYHSRCFRCSSCRAVHESTTFYERGGQALCRDCFRRAEGYVCHSCREVIAGVAVSACGHHFHPEHFVCEVCRCKLECSYFMLNNRVVCERCCATCDCPGCGSPITTEFIAIESEKWHPKCFKCCQCSHPLANEIYALGGGQFYCERCADKL